MRPDQSDDVLREIRAELMVVAPSPAFAAGVRAKVEGRQSASPFLRWALAAAAVIAVASSGYWLASERPAPQIAMAPSTPEPAGVAPQPSAPRVEAKPVAKAGATTVTVLPAGPDLTVITDQPEAIRRVWTRAVADVSGPGSPPDEIREITVAPVVVNPIVIPLIGDAGRGGVTPTVRANADNATRSER